MNDLISRSALLKSFKLRCQGNCKKCIYSTFLASDEHCGLIDEAPKVEAVPRAALDHIIERLEALPIKTTSKWLESKEVPEWFYEVITGEYINKEEVMKIIKEGLQ